MRPSRTSISTAVILCAALALRCLGLDKSMWLDEFSSLSVAVGSLRNYDHPPAYFLGLRWLLACGAQRDAVLRFPSVVCGMACLFIFMRMLRTYSDEASLLGGTLALASPLLLRYSQEARNYGLLLLGTAWAFHAAAALVQNPASARPYASLLGALLLASASHTVGVMLPASVAAFIYLQPPPLRRDIEFRRLRAVFGIAVASSAFWIAIFLRQTHKSAATWWMPHISASLLAKETAELCGLDCLPLFLTLFLLALLVTSRNWSQSLPFLAAAAAFWLQVVALSIVAVPIFIARVLSPTLLPLLAFVAIHLEGARSPWRQGVVGCTIAAVGLWLGVAWIQTAWIPFEPWREITAAAAADMAQDDTAFVAAFPYHNCAVGVAHYFGVGLDRLRVHPTQDLPDHLFAVPLHPVTLAGARTVYLFERTVNDVTPSFRAAEERQRQDVEGWLSSHVGKPAWTRQMRMLRLLRFDRETHVPHFPK